MPLSVFCRKKGDERTIPVVDALRLSKGERRELICCECESRVIPHSESNGGTQGAHFEHYRWSEKCSLCEKRS